MPNTCRSDEPYLASTQFSKISIWVLRTANGVPAGPREERRQAGVLT